MLSHLMVIAMEQNKLFDSVVLLEDIPTENLRRGNVGAIVEIYKGGEAFEVEFVDTHGKTYGLLALKPQQFIVLSHESYELLAA